MFYSTDVELKWEILGSGLPNVVITDLDFHATENILVAASYGRGMYKIDLDDLDTGIHEAVDENKFNLQVTPNPFSGESTLHISVIERTIYSISIFNQSGQVIELLYQGVLNEGLHEFRFDASHLSSGLYICSVANVKNGAVRSTRVIKN